MKYVAVGTKTNQKATKKHNRDKDGRGHDGNSAFRKVLFRMP